MAWILRTLRDWLVLVIGLVVLGGGLIAVALQTNLTTASVAPDEQKIAAAAPATPAAPVAAKAPAPAPPPAAPTAAAPASATVPPAATAPVASPPPAAK